jgi:hypothetical protein
MSATRETIAETGRKKMAQGKGRSAAALGYESQKSSSGEGVNDANQLPHGWRFANLPDLGELSRGKSKHRPRNEPKLYGGPYPFIQTGDIRESGGTFGSTHRHTASWGFHKADFGRLEHCALQSPQTSARRESSVILRAFRTASSVFDMMAIRLQCALSSCTFELRRQNSNDLPRRPRRKTSTWKCCQSCPYPFRPSPSNVALWPKSRSNSLGWRRGWGRCGGCRPTSNATAPPSSKPPAKVASSRQRLSFRGQRSEREDAI